MIDYNEKYYTKDGKPWYPVMGEFQYSRSDRRTWKESLSKLSATGINVVASYAFWIHHEEVKGRFDFNGNKNLRAFLREIQEAGLRMCLRIGPWVHAEARNGGFPDWLENESCKLRSNDPVYMQYVERYFRKIYEQCEGYLDRDGGPLFAVQVENEYSQWGAQGEDIGDAHINALIALLKRIGLDVPVYMATGWGVAATGSAVPVWGGYADAPWERVMGELPPREGYLISSNPNDAEIGSDTGKKYMDVNITNIRYPYSTVELGSGIQVTKVRRPIVSGRDMGALAACRIASGAASLGYYVYHGGTNPVGALSSMQEYRKNGPLRAGFCCDLPELNYDFQAAIGQYGDVREGARELKLWNYFAREFGVEQMDTHYPADNASASDDFKSLRYSIREKDGNGFLFINNYVRHYDLPERRFNEFSVSTRQGEVKFPAFCVSNRQICAFPFRMRIGGALLECATATPLCRLNGNEVVFYAPHGQAEYRWNGGRQGKIVTLDEEDALNCYKFKTDGKERLFIADGELFVTDEGLHYHFYGAPKLKIYPPLENVPAPLIKTGEEGVFGVYAVEYEDASVKAELVSCTEKEEYTDFTIRVDYGRARPSGDVFLLLDYGGDRADLLVDGEKVNDHFYTGQPFAPALRGYGFPKEIVLRVYPLHEDAFVYVERRPHFAEGRAMYLESVSVKCCRRTVLPLCI